MTDIPQVKPGEWITIGEHHTLRAVVCRIYEGLSADGGNIEVVYLDRGGKAVNIDVKWTGTHWEPAREGAYGGYADQYPRLAQYVRILRQGER